jgi:hypothetical protein
VEVLKLEVTKSKEDHDRMVAELKRCIAEKDSLKREKGTLLRHLAEYGNHIYYGDIYGEVTALFF